MQNFDESDVLFMPYAFEWVWGVCYLSSEMATRNPLKVWTSIEARRTFCIPMFSFSGIASYKAGQQTISGEFDNVYTYIRVHLVKS